MRTSTHSAVSPRPRWAPYLSCALAFGCGSERGPSLEPGGAEATLAPEALAPGSPAGGRTNGAAGRGAARPAGGPEGVEAPGSVEAGSEGSPQPASGAVVDLGEPVPDDGEQTWVFEPSEVHTYTLTLDPDVWAALQLNARDEEYAEAELVAAGQRLGSVGLRFKGSLGTLASCFEDDGTPRCEKLSMKLKFDEYSPDQRFFGLKRLNFNSMLFDDTLMHERLAYRVYRELGIPAPRSSHARLVINGEDWGVFSLVEDVDGRFTDHHFAGGDGNLYKEAWPGNADDELLAERLETNEEIGDHSGFLEFQSELLGAPPEALPDVLERYMDVDATLAYLAVDQTITNWDGITAFYCYDEYCENHNYYLYQDELETRFSLIPWDLDNTFETSPLAGVPGTFEAPDDCSVIYEAMGRNLRAPACDPLLFGLITSGSERYLTQLDRVLDGPLAPGVIESWVDELEAQLLPEVQSDSRGPDPDTFGAAVGRLRTSLERLREAAELDRSSR